MNAIRLRELREDDNVNISLGSSELINWYIVVPKEKIMKYFGCRFLIVDAKLSAIGFYEKSGFTLLNAEENKKSEYPMLYIDLHKL
ncbi:hypothetical protein [Nitrosomonas oligotropha]|uniref:hypothetical protein n=1 Tax=Nitrosomonas oligotropha TaxID=42354 RepID=UPI000D3087C4|nr:hypothetical protein [Nitrosomonas oligotropha]